MRSKEEQERIIKRALSMAANISEKPAGIELAVDRVIDEPMIAVLIDSTVLGAPIWFALRDDWKPDPGDSTPVFYACELPFLRTKSAETLCQIFKVKTFGGGMVRQ